jgi:glutamate--cysteine ligase catalytic subunit
VAPFHLNGISLNDLSFQIDNAGLLKVGVPKTWKESKQDLHYIRKAGIRQFVSTYNRVKDLKGDELLWGDEIEYGIFHIDPETKKIRLSLRAKTVSKICRTRSTSSTEE